MIGDHKGKWDGDPDAQSIKAVHGLTGLAVSQECPHADDDVPWAVFGHDQMSQTPDGESTKDEPRLNGKVGQHRTFQILRCADRAAGTPDLFQFPSWWKLVFVNNRHGD